MAALHGTVVTGNPDANRRALLAEIGFTQVTPSVFTQAYPRDRADLWLPMAADNDTTFNLQAPAPQAATSVLGLLLRNAALRLAAGANHEVLGSGSRRAGECGRARRASRRLIANLPAAAGLASTTLAGFSADATESTAATQAAGPGKDVDGSSFRIQDRLADILANPLKFPADQGRYFDSDALAAFRDAVAAIAGIATERRAVLTGEILDCASHRYDAWVTSPQARAWPRCARSKSAATRSVPGARCVACSAAHWSRCQRPRRCRTARRPTRRAAAS